MTITYENTDDDVVEGAFYRTYGIPAAKRETRQLRLVLFFGALAVILLLGFLGSVGFSRAGIIVPILAPLLALNLIVTPFGFRYLIRQAMKQTKTENPHHRERGRRTVAVRPDGLFIVATGQSETLLYWNEINAVTLGEKFLVIQWAKLQHVTIPRRAFADAAQEVQFLTDIERYRTAPLALSPPLAITTTPVATIPQTSPTVSNAPWWSGQKVTDVGESEKINLNQRNG